MKKLYQVLIVLDDMADSPQVHKKTGDGILDTLFIRGRHYCINTWVSTQKLRLMPSAVHVNTMWYLRLPAPEPARTGCFGGRVERHAAQGRALRNVRGSHAGEVQLLVRQSASPQGRHVLGAIRPKVPRKRAWGRSSARWWGNCCSSETSVRSFWRKKRRIMTTIYIDSRKRVAGDDSSFEFDIGETIHMQTGAKLSVLKLRVADAFLSTVRGQYLYWIDEALQTLNWATLPVGAYTGTRLAAWISSNYAAATYVAETNEIQLNSTNLSGHAFSLLNQKALHGHMRYTCRSLGLSKGVGCYICDAACKLLLSFLEII